MKANFRNTGSARSGFGEWLLQRLSALYLGGFTLWLALWFGLAPPADHAAWKAWLAGGAARLAFALFFLSALVHAWVGLRSVFLDYLLLSLVLLLTMAYELCRRDNAGAVHAIGSTLFGMFYVAWLGSHLVANLGRLPAPGLCPEKRPNATI